ncbi:hypothetical protein C8R46DRAFT_1043608 [Mycena filopes]|nr:hypothetical protein C8R46DRAFT_1043608 [Mycena filopes]
MPTQEHDNVAALCTFLRLPTEPGCTEPPHIPLNLEGLPAAAYIEAALLYVEQYLFDREFYKYKPKTKTRKRHLFTADSEWKENARTYLKACIIVDRSGLVALRTSYNAAHEQQNFVRNIIFPRRWSLEELASEMLALVELGAFFRQSVSS